MHIHQNFDEPANKFSDFDLIYLFPKTVKVSIQVGCLFLGGELSKKNSSSQGLSGIKLNKCKM